jgi:YD repeat-containing protein
VDPSGLDLETTYTYDSYGNVATRTDPRGNVWTSTWDTLRRLKSTKTPTPSEYEVKHEYDENGNRTQTDVQNVDKDGSVVTANPWLTTTRTFTNTDDLASITEEIDSSTTRTTDIDYDSNQNRIRITKPEGNKYKWEVNERDWIVAFLRGEGETEETEAGYAYDENGNLITETDGRGKDTDHTYDLFDRRTQTTNELGHYTAWTYDKNGNVTQIAKKDSGDVVIQREDYYFDERNRHWKTSALFKDPSATYSDAVTTIARLKTDQVATITNPRSKTTTYSYDDVHRLVNVTDAMGNEIDYTLDANGNRTAWELSELDSSTPVVHEFEATYDELNRRATKTEIDRTNGSSTLVTQYFYDSRSNLAFLINAEGNPTRWTFDGRNRMIKKETALTLGGTIDDFSTAQVTQWGFDDNDRLISHKDDGPNETTWDYDAVDRPVTMTYPDSSTVGYEYDLADNVVKVTDPSGNEVEDTFDDLNRNTSRSVSLVSGFLGTTSETRTFDAVNRMLTTADNDYKVEFGYTVIGLHSYVYAEEQSYVGMTAYAKAVTTTRDANGNPITQAYPSGSSLSLNRTYGDIDQLTQINDGTNVIASFSRIGPRKKITTLQNGATTTLSYTGFRNEIDYVHHETSAPVTISKFGYAYNDVHDRLWETDVLAGTGDAFVYDKMRRLTVAWMGSTDVTDPSSNTYTKKIEYNYDDDGNRTRPTAPRATPWSPPIWPMWPGP